MAKGLWFAKTSVEAQKSQHVAGCGSRGEAYREQGQCVLTLDVRQLVEAHGDRILLAHMNTGTTRPFAFPRGLNTFCTLEGYHRRRVVELTVKREVCYIRNFVLKVEELGGGKAAAALWEK